MILTAAELKTKVLTLYSDKPYQKALKAYRLALLYGFAKNKTTQISAKALTRYFGNNTMYRECMRRVNDRYCADTGEALTYRVDLDPVKDIEDAYFVDEGFTQPTDNEQRIVIRDQILYNFYVREYKDQLATCDFEYKVGDKSKRLINGIQNIKRDMRDKLVSEHSSLKYDTDLDCAAPTLLVQTAQKYATNKSYKYISMLLADKAGFRETLAVDSGFTVKDIKVIINSLFAGGTLRRNPNAANYTMLKSKYSYQDVYTGMKALQDNDLIIGLTKDIKDMWSVLKISGCVDSWTKTIVDKTTGEIKSTRTTISSKAKWAVYFKLERLIMSTAESYLLTNNIKYFLIHDGFYHDKLLDVNELINHIFTQTDYRVTFSTKPINNNIVKSTAGTISLCLTFCSNEYNKEQSLPTNNDYAVIIDRRYVKNKDPDHK